MDKGRILILGIGNSLMGDDGLGIHVIRELEKASLPEAVDIVDGGTKGLDLIPYFENKKQVIIIDAIDLNMEPGNLIILRDGQVKSYLNNTKLSAHDIGLRDLLSVLPLLDIRPGEIIIIGLQPEKIAVGTELSDPLKNGLPCLVDKIRDILHA